ncbi:MAG: (2Fe-2S) ferredoxin domain-containing protein [Cyanobacteria bacterium J06635_15]
MIRKDLKPIPQRFCLEGQFLGFAPGPKSPFKYLQLATVEGLTTIKLGKSLRLMMFRYLSPGDNIRVVGRQKLDKKTGETCFKAEEVMKLSTGAGSVLPVQIGANSTTPVAASPPRPAKTKAKVLVCQKSSCRKRGSRVVCDRLEAAIAQQGLTDQVKIVQTGCMDRCKVGPNVVFMPNKARHSRVSPDAIAALINQHYSALTADQQT